MKMMDVGKKSTSCNVPCEPIKEEKNKKYYPSFYLDVVPASLWSKDVDDEVIFTVKAVIKRKSVEENEKNKTKTMSLEIREISDDGKATMKDALEKETKRQME